MIELLVAVAIAAILAATVIVSVGRNADRDVRLERDRFTSFLQDVKNKSLTGAKVATAGKNCGFGVYRKSATEAGVYYVQTDLDTECSGVANNKGSNPDYNGETFILGHNAQFGDFNDIFFLIPSGKFYYGNQTDRNADITIQSSDSSTSVSPVTVNSAGMIQ